MRSNRVEIQLSDDEIAKLNKLRGSMRLRTFIRCAVLDSIPPTIPEINRRALDELHRIGSNLNQLARSVNQGEAADLLELRQQSAALRLALLEAREARP